MGILWINSNALNYLKILIGVILLYNKKYSCFE